MTTVFLSYRHEDKSHRMRVRDLAERLERAGLTVVLDQFAQQRNFNSGGPDDGWPRWSKSQAGNPAHKILIIASPGWFRCYEQREVPGAGLGAAAEAGVIEQRLYNSAGVSRDIRLVTLATLDPTLLPLDLQRYHRFVDPTDFDALVHWLTGTAQATPDPSAVADWPDSPPSLLWPMADHAEVRVAFERLIARGAPWRLLTLHGPSEAGKTHITWQILRNALRLPGLACGRFDFKGTTDVDVEVRAFVQHLDVPPPPPSSRLNERLSCVLDSLKHRARPALLVFDTYEAAGEAQDWLEKQLLSCLLRATWLRVVVAGQHIPQHAGALWEGDSFAPIRLSAPPPEDWFDFGRPYRPGITLDFVRQAHQLCAGRASVLAQLLGPPL